MWGGSGVKWGLLGFSMYIKVSRKVLPHEDMSNQRGVRIS